MSECVCMKNCYTSKFLIRFFSTHFSHFVCFGYVDGMEVVAFSQVTHTNQSIFCLVHFYVRQLIIHIKTGKETGKSSQQNQKQYSRVYYHRRPATPHTLKSAWPEQHIIYRFETVTIRIFD